MSEPRGIFISGAAAGIGRATTIHFLRQGWRVGAFDVNHEALQQLANSTEIETEYRANLITGRLDVTDSEQWQAALATFMGFTNGQLHVLFNNAGILYSGPFQNVELSAQHRTMAVNINGVLNGCYLAFPYLKNTPHATVINMSSASAIYGQPSLASYSASKFAVRALTEALNLEWQPLGIRVIDAMPLFVKTDMVTDMNAASIHRLGVRLTPEQIAEQIYVMSQSRSFRPHWPIGIQTRIALLLSKLSPDWLAKLSNKWIARS